MIGHSDLFVIVIRHLALVRIVLSVGLSNLRTAVKHCAGNPITTFSG